MKIYFDESMPGDSSSLLLGTLIIPNKSNDKLHKQFLDLKRKHRITTELKYAYILNRKMCDAAKEAITLFAARSAPYFKCIITPYDASTLGINDLQSKRLSTYVSNAIKLIQENLPISSEVEIFLDEEKRIEKTELRNTLLTTKLSNGAKVNYAEFVKSHDDVNCLSQLADLLIGGITQNLFPTIGKKSRFKREFASHHLTTFGANSYKKSDWELITSTRAKEEKLKIHVKYQ